MKPNQNEMDTDVVAPIAEIDSTCSLKRTISDRQMTKSFLLNLVLKPGLRLCFLNLEYMAIYFFTREGDLDQACLAQLFWS